MAMTSPVSIYDVDGKKHIKIRPENPEFRVLLSVDGGGVRGIIPATILEGFERCVKEVLREKLPELKDLEDDDMIVDVAECFDGIAGNSAGSLLALYFSSGGGLPEIYKQGKVLEGFRPGSAAGAVKMFDALARDIFKVPIRGRIPLLSGLLCLFHTKYSSRGLEGALQSVFGDLTLRDLKLSTYIPAYELENATPCGFWCRRKPGHKVEAGYAHFHRDGMEKTPDLIALTPHLLSFPADVPLRKAGQASASAPIYFPKTEANKKDLGLPVGQGKSDKISWVDGGVVSNNPTLQALFFMGSTFADSGNRFLPPEKLAVMSIGTGGRVQAPHIGRRQGLLGWGANLVSVLMDSHTEMNSALVDDFFYGGVTSRDLDGPDRYIRITKTAKKDDPDYEALGALDLVGKMAEMKDIGKRIVEHHWDEMKKFIKFVLMAESEEPSSPARSKSSFT